jgi:hypothetical protein
MSIATVAPPTSPLFSFLMPAINNLDPLSEGSATNAAPIPNYLGSCSRIVGCVREVSAGPAPGSVVVVQGAKTGTIAPPTVGYGALLIVSQVAPGDDLSQYRVYWTNEVARSDSDLLVVRSC